MSLVRPYVDYAIEQTMAQVPEEQKHEIDSELLINVYQGIAEKLEKTRFFNPLKKLWIKACIAELRLMADELKTIPNN